MAQQRGGWNGAQDPKKVAQYASHEECSANNRSGAGTCPGPTVGQTKESSSEKNELSSLP
ncbi:extracellular solute-binding protein family 1 [Pseudomonas sp. Os17]|nr:extracellular solute-binding protein family 1 [Pseudomonas sp. Os17]BAQ83256.1 extracellular solute-binding protein family 1 [Pseudomonas sp. St29]